MSKILKFTLCLSLILCVGGCSNKTTLITDEEEMKSVLKENGYTLSCNKNGNLPHCAYTNDSESEYFMVVDLEKDKELDKNIFIRNEEEKAERLGIDVSALYDFLKSKLDNYTQYNDDL